MNTVTMASTKQPKQAKLYVWLEPETKERMQKLLDRTGSKYESLSRMARLWIEQKLDEEDISD